jgi:hypothetical protein
MREIDFLPTWYPEIQRRYRRMIAQAWTTMTILLVLVSYAAIVGWKERIVIKTTAQTEAQIRSSRQQLTRLTEKVEYENELRRQEQIVARLGIGVDTTRLLKALEDAMTPEMTLTNLSIETVEQTQQSAAILHTRTIGAADSQPPADRMLKVLVDGAAPTNTEVATLIEHLQKRACFENITQAYMREGHSSDGHLMQEFELTFDINLTAAEEERQ